MNLTIIIASQRLFAQNWLCLIKAEWFQRLAPKQTSSTAHGASSTAVMDINWVAPDTPRAKMIQAGVRLQLFLVWEVGSNRFLDEFLLHIRAY